MAKDFSKFNDDNPVMAILNMAKQEEEKEKTSPKIETEEAPDIRQSEESPSENIITETPKTEDIKKILMNISIRESTKKEWKMFFLEHDLSMTQGIETAVEYLMSEVKKNNIKLSKGGITK